MDDRIFIFWIVVLLAIQFLCLLIILIETWKGKKVIIAKLDAIMQKLIEIKPR